jgi:hypothetical protein
VYICHRFSSIKDDLNSTDTYVILEVTTGTGRAVPVVENDVDNDKMKVNGLACCCLLFSQGTIGLAEDAQQQGVLHLIVGLQYAQFLGVAQRLLVQPAGCLFGNHLVKVRML